MQADEAILQRTASGRLYSLKVGLETKARSAPAVGGVGSVLGMVIGAMILGVVSSAAYGMLLRPEWQFILKAIVTFLAIIAQRYLLVRRNK